MENNEPKGSETQEQGPRKSIVIIVISILLGTNGLLLWQFFEKKASLDAANQTVITTTAEKDQIQMELNQVKGEFEKVKAENLNLRDQLTVGRRNKSQGCRDSETYCHGRPCANC